MTVRKYLTQSPWYSWLVITLCALFLLYKYVLQVSPNVLGGYLAAEFHLNGVELGNLAASFFYTYMATQLFVGVILDRFSVRWICTFAILLSAMGALGFAYANSLIEATLYRGLMGVGAAFATVCYLKNAAVWFKPKQYALVSGLLATAAMVGAICGQSPFAQLNVLLGAENTLAVVGALGIAIAILFWLWVRDEPYEQSLLTKDSVALNQTVSLKAVLKILKNRQNWLLMFYSGLTFSPVAVFGGLWGDPFLHVAYHMSALKGSSFVSLVFLGLALGGPILGGLSDALQNRRLTMVFGNTFSLVSVLVIVYADNLPLWLLALLLFCFGFGIGAFMLGFTVGKEINPLPLAATVVALINTGDAVMGAFTEPLIGKILDMGLSHKMVALNNHLDFSLHDFHVAFILLPGYLLLATFLLIFIKNTSGHTA